jgi:predicted nucleic acid-binding protein
MLTVWPALTEAMHFAKRAAGGQDSLCDLLERRVVRLADLETDDVVRMRYLMRKYRDLPMDLADAALVALAERERMNRIFTIDRRGFSVYKPAGMKRFDIIP